MRRRSVSVAIWGPVQDHCSGNPQVPEPLTDASLFRLYANTNKDEAIRGGGDIEGKIEGKLRGKNAAKLRKLRFWDLVLFCRRGLRKIILQRGGKFGAVIHKLKIEKTKDGKNN